MPKFFKNLFRCKPIQTDNIEKAQLRTEAVSKKVEEIAGYTALFFPQFDALYKNATADPQPEKYLKEHLPPYWYLEINERSYTRAASRDIENYPELKDELELFIRELCDRVRKAGEILKNPQNPSSGSEKTCCPPKENHCKITDSTKTDGTHAQDC